MEHEYAILGGVNRASIGRYLAILAALVAAAVGAGVLSLVDIAKRFGWAQQAPALVLWPLTAGVVYAFLYWLFDNWMWKWLSRWLKVPNLGGTWQCEGQGMHADKSPGAAWSAEVIIVQTWDRIRLRMKTAQSTSSSFAAAVAYDRADGFKLFYNFRNEPGIGEGELHAHRGCAELSFAPDLKSATGGYFNGHGRYTFGIMKLNRKNSS